jgi:hypothetical protein
MKRRSFVGLLWGVPAMALIPPEAGSEPSHDPEGPSPPHECVDRPELPCPACLKWTGDPLAIQKNLPEAPRLRKLRSKRAG